MRFFNEINIIFVLLVERTTSFLSSSDYNKSQTFILSGRSRAIVRHLGDDSNEGDNNDGIFGGIKSFFKELDNFIDDAFARRLGNGSAFYGKRKSNFYGELDKNKKQSDGFNPQEDYRGPDSSGFFKWIEDSETGEMVPVSRMKYKNLEKKVPSSQTVNEENDISD